MMSFCFFIFALVFWFILLGGFTLANISYVSHYAGRQRRYLSFPNKAAVGLTISLLKSIANDVSPGPTVKIVTIHELDVIFPLPHNPSPFKLTQTAFGQTPVFTQTQVQARSRHRRDVYRQLEDLFYLQGYDGKLCILKAICDAKNFPKTKEENLLLDIMSVIFSFPSNSSLSGVEEEYHVIDEDCIHYKNHCPFSIFDLAFGWAEQFSILYNA